MSAVRFGLTVGQTQVRIEANNAGVGVARRRLAEVEGEQVWGRWQRRAVGIGDHPTLADYRVAVRDMLVELGLTQQEASDAFWLRVTQAQWANR